MPASGLQQYWRQLSKRTLLICALALSASLLLAQGIELSHHHDNLQSQLDCQICLKHSSKGKLVSASDLDLELQGSTTFATGPQAQQPFLALPPAKSRAPPVLS